MPIKSMSTLFFEIPRKMTMCERKYITRDLVGMARKSMREPFVEIPRKRIWLNVRLCCYANEIHLVLVEFL